jgi:hypothetical protein
VRVAIETLRRQARALKRQHGLPFDFFVRNLLIHNARSTAFLRIA